MSEVRKKLMEELKVCAAKDVTELNPSKNSDFTFRFQLKDPNQEPICSKSRTVPFYLKEKVKQAFEDQIIGGVCRSQLQQTGWAFPLRVLMKPDVSVRITVDYKALNKVCITDRYPLPSVIELYAKLVKARVFCKIHLKAAYHPYRFYKIYGVYV
jgi:hypothetical protein